MDEPQAGNEGGTGGPWVTTKNEQMNRIVFNKEVIKPGKLSSTAGRKAWLAAEKYSRELRFVKAPKSGKK